MIILISYSGSPGEINPKKLAEKIESIILNNIPVEISICFFPPAPGATCNSGHSLVLAGVKMACNSNESECKTMVKVQNSAGQGWQNHTNGGWVDLTIAKASTDLSNTHQISWIQKPGRILENKNLSKVSKLKDDSSSASSLVPTEYKSYHGVWKCLNSYSDTYKEGCTPYQPKH